MKLFILKIFSPIRYFINDSRAVGIILIICTIVSIVITNSFLGDSYHNFWLNDIHSAEALRLPGNYLEWINNFLMGIFFLMAGTEIKRELIEGELSSFKKAVLPFGAAVGGMLVPALIFVSFNLQTEFLRGWGVPTATDIAFSLGVASLLGKRVPLNLKILLMALAIIDDLGAILVIALFYGGMIHWIYLAIAALLYGFLFSLNYFKVKFGPIQIILAVAMWYIVLQSGIEASITGVLFAFAIPVHKLVAVEKTIHNSVNFLILPLFALANTSIFLPSNPAAALTSTLGMGIMMGLIVGKPLGIFLVSYILVSLNIAKLPTNIKWRQILGMGTLAGIGFTMSIFTTMLAFSGEEHRDIAKIAILLSVTISAIASIVYFSQSTVEPFKPAKLAELKFKPA